MKPREGIFVVDENETIGTPGKWQRFKEKLKRPFKKIDSSDYPSTTVGGVEDCITTNKYGVGDYKRKK